MPPSNQFIFCLHGIGISVSASPGVISALASRFGEFPSAPASEAILHFHFYCVSSIANHRVSRPAEVGRPFYSPAEGEALYFADDKLYLNYADRVRVLCTPASGECSISFVEPEIDQLWLATHPLFTIPLIEMLKRRGKFNLHAAAFAQDGQCLLLPGASGSGKSTLSVALLQAGIDYLGDDMVFMERAGEQLIVRAFPEHLDVTAQTATFFETLRPLTAQVVRPGWPKHQLRPADYFPTKIAWSATPQAIVFPKIGREKTSVLSEMTPDDAFRELSASVLLTDPASTKSHLAVFAQLVNITPAYRLRSGRDFNQISDLLSGLLS